MLFRSLNGTLPIDDYLADVNGRSIEYAGFNLLLGTRDELWHYNANHTEPTRLQAGVYGLSNAGLDTPWPKLLKAKAALRAVLDDPQPEALLAILSDPLTAPFADLPDTGVGLATGSEAANAAGHSRSIWVGENALIDVASRAVTAAA